MVCWPRTRQWPRRNNCRGTERAGRDGAVIAAAVAVHTLFAATFCSAAEPRGTIEEDIAVTIPPDIEAQILRYYHAERWRVGTIAKQLRVHRDTVSRDMRHNRNQYRPSSAGCDPSLRLFAPQTSRKSPSESGFPAAAN